MPGVCIRRLDKTIDVLAGLDLCAGSSSVSKASVHTYHIDLFITELDKTMEYTCCF